MDTNSVFRIVPSLESIWGEDAKGAASVNRLVELVDADAGEQLRVEVGRFLRHHATAERRVGDLLDGGRLEEEGDLGRAVARLFHGGVDAADVAEVLLVADGVLG